MVAVVVKTPGQNQCTVSAEGRQNTEIRDCSWLPGGFTTAMAALVQMVLLSWKAEELGGGLVSRLHGRVNGRAKYCRGG